MNDTIYSAEFARQLCDEYNSLKNRINRAIKEAVSEGIYQTSVVVNNACLDHDEIVNCVKKFGMAGYTTLIQEESIFKRDVCRILISWG